MTQEVATFFEQWQADRQKMKEQAPDIARGFAGFYQTIMKDGVLPLRDKELIALAIALALQCSPCIDLHVQGCLKAGASREQILEAVGVSVIMQGGPAFTHVPEVLRALDHLEHKAASS
jgi:AhpD family alkylhydroperoxidase